jgi:hypothetical protein
VTDTQRALVWIDNRFDRILTPGLHAIWTGVRKVRVEVLDIANLRFEHAEIDTITDNARAQAALQVVQIDQGFAAPVFDNGAHQETLKPGAYAF